MVVLPRSTLSEKAKYNLRLRTVNERHRLWQPPHSHWENMELSPDVVGRYIDPSTVKLVCDKLKNRGGMLTHELDELFRSRKDPYPK